ncbi:calcium ATPase [Martensiomyces pterosporus]|nr:calcium ATPase [Martensiomyces pterosporus]
MEIQIADSRPPQLSQHATLCRSNLHLAAEFRTLSIQLSETQERTTQRRQTLQAFLRSPRWRELLNELIPLRSAHQQRQTYEHQRDVAMIKIAEQLRNLRFHMDTVNEVYTRFNTSPLRGLEAAAVERRAERHGRNVFSPASRRIPQRVVSWFFGGFNRFLWLAMVVFWLCWKPIGNPPQPGNMAMAIVIILVICIQAAFNAWQEWITSRAMDSITNMLPTETLALRDGVAAKLPPADLVPGDIVRLHVGDKVPADMRLVEVSQDLMFDRSILTGIPDPTIGTVSYTNANYLETRNMAMMGINVTQGQCTGVVVATGDRTVLGRINRLTQRKKPERTILQIEVHRLVNGLTTLSLVVGGIFIILWAVWLRTSFPGFMSVSDALANGVGVLVTFVPGSLPISLTLALTAIAKRMQRHNVLIKNLTTVETLGSVNVICCEKTGTMTQRRMVAVRAAFSDKEVSFNELVSCSGSGAGRESSERLPAAIKRLYETSTLCNDASFDASSLHLSINERVVTGDATDSALLRLAEHLRPTQEAQHDYSVLYTIPFSLRNRWMLSICKEPSSADPSPFMLIKGAPEQLYRRCTQIQDSQGKLFPFGREMRARLEEIQLRWAQEGSRVLLLCRRDFESKDNPFVGIEDSPAKLYAAATESIDHLCIVGIVGMVDPPREEIPGVVDTFRGAGIRVFMVTGDYAPTAAYVARQCRIITGTVIDHIGDVLARAESLISSEKRVISSSFSSSSQGRGRMKVKDGVRKLGGWHRESPSTTATGLLECSCYSTSLSAHSSQLHHVNSADSGEHSLTTVGRISSSASGSPECKCRHSLVVSGPELVGLQSEHWDAIATYEEIVFARITPEQKLQIVEELRVRENYVAVTGDDVNDLPAMRAAHVGVAMGNGSEVAKEVAEMVLLDNNFSSIVVAIECGRLVFANLQKVIIYLLPVTNLSEIVPSFLNVVLGLPIPLSTFLMLVINTITDVWASVKLIDEEPENDILLHPPRNPKKEGLVNARFFLQAYGFIGLIQTLTGHFMFFLCIYLRGGIEPRHVFLAFNKWTDGYMGKTKDELAQIVNVAGSVHFITLVIMQWGNMFVARTRTLSVAQQNPFWGPKRNLQLLAAVPISIVVALFVNEIHWFNSVFLTGKIPLEFFFIPIPFAMALVACEEVRKMIVRCYPRSIVARLAW